MSSYSEGQFSDKWAHLQIVSSENYRILELCWSYVLSRFSYVRLFAILSTLALQAPLSLGFARQGYWNGLPYPPPGDFPDPEIEITCAQSWPTLCDPMDCSPRGSSAHGMFQARILECVVISYFRGSFRPREWTRIPCVSCTDRQILYHCITWESVTIYR